MFLREGWLLLVGPRDHLKIWYILVPQDERREVETSCEHNIITNNTNSCIIVHQADMEQR